MNINTGTNRDFFLALQNAQNDHERKILQYKYTCALALRKRIIKNIDDTFGGRVYGNPNSTSAGRSGRSGGLRNSIEVFLDDEPYVSIGHQGVPYWRIHEYGGIIRPVNKKWLTIPASDKYRGKRAFEFNNLTFINHRNDAQRAYLIDRLNNRIAYFLRKKVTIPARPYIGPACEAFLAEDAQRIWESMK